ncbi:MAG: pyrroloquinoline quinone-dependent dehydrogenase [Pseudomonadota bacterium]
MITPFGTRIAHRVAALCAGLLAAVLSPAGVGAEKARVGSWSQYGGDDAGTRYAPHDQINPQTIKKLRRVWTYRTGELERRSAAMNVNSSNENTPIVAAGSLIVCTPFNRVVALDPATGEERWTFDPQVRDDFPLPNQYVCRGVAQWRDASADDGAACAHRLFVAANDLRVIAIDAHTGERCAGFGENGEVRVQTVRAQRTPGEIKFNSAPAVVNDVVVVGSSILDNVRTDAPLGTVRAFDARTGAPAWTFDAVTPTADVGAANVWTAMATDDARDLVFLPTSSASPDFYGGERGGDNELANAIVAVRGATGERVWSQQLVRHDVWDYDLPSQPTLVDLRRDGGVVPAVVQTTKQGFVFIFHRETGAPIFPLTEVPVPASAALGEALPRSQPAPSLPAPLVPQRLTPDMAFGFTPIDKSACRQKIADARSEGLFTPPSVEGTIFYPSTAGGANWGGSAFDPARRLLFVNTSRVAQLITLEPKSAEDGEAASVVLSAKEDVSPQDGAPYRVRREWLLSPLGAPCSPPPWGGLTAINPDTGETVWDAPLGDIRDRLPVPLPMKTNLGTPNIGGPVATAGGLVFIAAAQDNYLRAYRSDTGEEVWRDKLPAGGQTTPMSYEVDGKQYVVITSGQHLWFQTPPGDYVVAYALED